MSVSTDNGRDANKLTFPLQLVITLISTVVSIVITVMATTWSMRSDIRDISTRMELRDSVYSQNIGQLKEKIQEQGKDIKMMQLDVTNIQLSLAKAGIPGSGGK